MCCDGEALRWEALDGVRHRVGVLDDLLNDAGDDVGLAWPAIALSDTTETVWVILR